MARRIVIGANSAGKVGIYVSKPGVDAYVASEANLLFSSERRHFMVVESGTLTLGAAGTGVRRNFARLPGAVPFVLCGIFNPRPAEAPVKAVVDATGFTAYPQPGPLGNYPAAGAAVRYYAFLKSQ